MTEKKRGARPGGGGGAGERPKIPSSHTSRPSREAAPRPPRHDAHGPPRTGRKPAPYAAGAPTRRNAVPSGGPAGPRVRKARGAPTPVATSSIASEGARTLAIRIASAALEKKALSVEVLDVAGKVDYADFLVLMTGRSDRQVQAIAQGIEEELKKHGHRPQAVEGLPHAHWVLMDYVDVVVHVFHDDARGVYDLDGLWMDARRIPVTVPGEDR